MSVSEMDKNLRAIKKAGEKLVGKQPYLSNGEKRSRKQVEEDYRRHWRWVNRTKEKHGC